MTVSEFSRAYFALGSDFRTLIVRRNTVEESKQVYAGDIHSEIYMHPDVRKANIKTWAIIPKEKKILVVVE